MKIPNIEEAEVNPIDQRKCSVCGKNYDFDLYNTSDYLYAYMKDKHICRECAFWEHEIDYRTPNTEVIKGEYYLFEYQIEPIVKKVINRYSKRFYLIFPDRTIKICDYGFLIGKIPGHYKKFFPNTAGMINSRLYSRLTNEYMECYSKGCFDRYNCWRYKKEESEPDGPYNEIPEDYYIGMEECHDFIDINLITGESL